jgi:hypothetical protein
VKNPEHHDTLTSRGHMYCGICERRLKDHERNALVWLMTQDWVFIRRQLLMLITGALLGWTIMRGM